MSWRDVGDFLLKGPQGSPLRQQLEQKQESIRSAKLENDQRQRENDLQFHQHMMDLGARPVVNGTVKRDLTLPDGRTIEGGLLDKADTSRVLPNPQDKNTGWELPTPEEQVTLHHKRALADIQQGAPEAELQASRAAAAKGAENKAGAAGTATGKSEAEQADLQSRGRDLSEEQASQFGLPAGRYLPEQLVQLGRGMGAANVRRDTSLTTTGLNNDARSQRQQSNQQFRDFESNRAQDIQQNIAAQRAAVGAGLNPNLAPMKLKQYDVQAQQWNQLNQQKQQGIAKLHAAQDAADPQMVPDGQSFVHPFLGTQQTMNPQWRSQIAAQAGNQQSELNRISAQEQAIAQVNGWDKQSSPAQGGSQPGGASPSQQRGAPSQPGSGSSRTVSSPPSRGGAAAPALPGAVSPAAQPGQPQTKKAVSDPLAESIANFKTPPPAAPRAGSPRAMRTYEGLMARIHAINPDYDVTEYGKKVAAQKDFSSGGKSGQQAIALNTLVRHSDDMLDAIDKLKNGGFTPGNAAMNKLKEIFGDAAPTNFDQLKNYVAGETVKLIRGGGGAEGDIAAAEANIARSRSPEQLAGAIRTNFSVAGGKMQALNAAGSASHLGDKFNVLDKGAAEIMSKRGYDPATLKPLSGAAGLPHGEGKAIDDATARKFYEAAGGDPARATKLATEAGWKVQ
jgi:hypothetical protein